MSTRLIELQPGQKFKLPHASSPTFTVTSHTPGPVASLTDATCDAPNQRIDDREYAAGEGTARHTFASLTEVELVE